MAYSSTLQKMKKIIPPINSETITGYLLALLVLIRMFFNAALPLMDKTEARYGEIARIMAETGEWVVLQIDYGIPFWAKPPLSSWLSAASISLFGAQEFFVRLPYLIVSLLLVFFVGKYRPNKKMSKYLPGLILFSIPEFYLHAGVVSTDTLLTFSVAMVMLSFWEAVQPNAKRLWGYLFFVGMGLGLLAKGPIVGILTVPPLLLWCAISDFKWRNLIQFPFIIGSLITLLIAVPWYLLAEIRSPGFVDYFIVGEHFKRYLDSSWSGDKYGFPKQQPLGMVWVFLVGATLPWMILFLRKISRKLRTIRTQNWPLFLLLWFVWTPLFFTSSKSLIHPYTLPVMLPFSLLIAHYWSEVKTKKIYLGVSSILPILLIIGYFSSQVDKVFQDNSDKYLIEKLKVSDHSLYALEFKSYSSQFYSNGQIKIINTTELEKKIADNKVFYILIDHSKYKLMDADIKQNLTKLDTSKKRALYKTF